MYRKVATEIWTDQKFRALPAPGKLMFIYLFTNPHTHVGGLYYLPDTLISRETGLKQEAIDTLWDTLSKSDLALRDKENDIVWVLNMLRWQASGAKILRGVSNHLKTLHNSIFIPKFLEKYPSVKRFYRVTLSNTLSSSKPGVSQGGKQEQEQYSSSNEEENVAEIVRGSGNPDRPKKARKQAEGAHPELIRSFTEAWKAKYGAEYKFNKGKDGKHVQWILKAVDGDAREADRVISAYIADEDPWLAKQAHPLSVLISSFNKYRARRASSHPEILQKARKFE